MERHVHQEKWKVKNHGGDAVTVWQFCGCGAVLFGNGVSGRWNTLDEAWTKSKGPWRKWFLRFLQAHDEVVRDIPDDLRSHLLRWARFSECKSIPEEDFDTFLLDYWNYSGRAPKVSYPRTEIIATREDLQRMTYTSLGAGQFKTPDGAVWTYTSDNRYRQVVPPLNGSEHIYDVDPSCKTPLTKETNVKFLTKTQRTMAGYVGQIVDENENGEILWESEPFEDIIDDDHNLLKEGADLAIVAAQEKLTEVKKGLFA